MSHKCPRCEKARIEKERKRKKLLKEQGIEEAPIPPLEELDIDNINDEQSGKVLKKEEDIEENTDKDKKDVDIKAFKDSEEHGKAIRDIYIDE